VGGAGGTGGGAGAGGAGGTGAAGSGGAGGLGGSGDSDAGADAGPTCQGADLSGIGVPAGTVATADVSFDPAHGPGLAADGDLTTQWNAGQGTGSITFTFPTPIMISSLRIHADALPVTDETYTVTAGTSTSPIGVATRTVPLSPGGALPDIQVTPGVYSSITIAVDAGSSWVGIDEIWIIASGCP
jgi:hypothetical protein